MAIRGFDSTIEGANEGGFAHVYIVRLKEKMKLSDGSIGDIACLKRVVAPDKEALGIVRTEVDTMVRNVVD
jgi:hypothetical protein